MRGDEFTIMQIGTCVRVSLRLWAGNVGPRGPAGFIANMMVRDMDFFVQLAREVRVSELEMFSENKAQNDLILAARRATAEAQRGAEEVLTVVARLRRTDHRWPLFEKVVHGQTPKQIVKVCRDRADWSVIDDLWKVRGVIAGSVSAEILDLLLTFRQPVA